MPMIVHGSSVYQYRSKNKWKECWLSLEENGILHWKRKDAFLPLATVKLADVIDQIKIETAYQEVRFSNAKCCTPFVISIPMRPNRPNTKFAFLHGPDMELWLDAFASGINARKIYRGIRNKLTARVAGKNFIAEDVVEELLNYEDLLAFYKTIWQDFLTHRADGTSLGPEPIRVFRTKSVSDDKENEAPSDKDDPTRAAAKIKKDSVLRFSEDHKLNDANGDANSHSSDRKMNGTTNAPANMQNGNTLRKNGHVGDHDTKNTTTLLEMKDAKGNGHVDLEDDVFITVINIDHYKSNDCCKNGDCIIRL